MLCSSCGCTITDSQNISKELNPYPHDKGFGTCFECGIEKIKGMCIQLFPMLRESICEKHREKFDSMSEDQKCSVVFLAFKDGVLK